MSITEEVDKIIQEVIEEYDLNKNHKEDFIKVVKVILGRVAETLLDVELPYESDDRYVQGANDKIKVHNAFLKSIINMTEKVVCAFCNGTGKYKGKLKFNYCPGCNGAGKVGGLKTKPPLIH